jgi:hypothetical protein
MFTALGPSTPAGELLSMEHVDDLLVCSIDAEDIADVPRRIPWGSITDQAEFPQGALSQMDEGFNCKVFELMVELE